MMEHDDDDPVEMVAAGTLPAAQAGFHYRGQPPTVGGDGQPSLLAHYHPGKKGTVRDRYGHLFSQQKDKDDNLLASVTCLCCRVAVAVKFNSSSSKEVDLTNFSRHLENFHRSELTPTDQLTARVAKKEEKKQDQLSGAKRKAGDSGGSGGGGAAAGGINTIGAQWAKHSNGASGSTVMKRKVTTALANMIANNGAFPLSMIEDADFRDGVRAVVKTFAPAAKVVFASRRTVRREVANIVVDANQEELLEFRAEKHLLLAITNDATVSRGQYSYTVLTASVITVEDKEWHLRERFLDCSPQLTTERHTAVNAFLQLKGKLAEVLGIDDDDFKITDRGLLRLVIDADAAVRSHVDAFVDPHLRLHAGPLAGFPREPEQVVGRGPVVVACPVV